MKTDQEVRLECLRQAVMLTAREGVSAYDTIELANTMFQWVIADGNAETDLRQEVQRATPSEISKLSGRYTLRDLRKRA